MGSEEVRERQKKSWLTLFIFLIKIKQTFGTRLVYSLRCVLLSFANRDNQSSPDGRLRKTKAWQPQHD